MEFARHGADRHENIDICFARPYHAWERIIPLEAKHIRDLLNDRPRRLGYGTLEA
jgi:hypothetical protein